MSTWVDMSQNHFAQHPSAQGRSKNRASMRNNAEMLGVMSKPTTLQLIMGATLRRKAATGRSQPAMLVTTF
jgi:hypothetical protein